ncbi:MAG: hemerythrin domain-containing protein [Candidatus Thermoplasmatota archaeon]|jgi:hypothetical protein
MKRHASLHPLSRDHHNVLVHARRLRGLDARFDAATARQRFLSYVPILSLHFDEEERILAPRIQDAALRNRLLAEHADLRSRFAALANASAEAQTELGQKLREHVRFEEDVLFPHLEDLQPGLDWPTVDAEASAFRAATRPASLGGGESCFL